MATLESLTALVTDIIQDSAFTGSITSYLNQGVMEIAGGMQSTLGSFITPPLPELFSIGTVSTVTDAAFVSMPATFQRDMCFAADSSGYEIEIYNSMIEFSQVYPSLTTSGSISAVVELGGNLYYQGIPTESEDVTVHFYRLPVDMASDSDTPDGIPLHLQVPLLVNYTCREIFSLIEDGIEGAPVNTQKYAGLLAQALRTLELSIPYDTRSLNILN